MLFFLLLLALIVPILVVGLLFSFSPTTIIVLLVVLVVVWVINRSYRDWKRKQDEQREGAEPALTQKDVEPAAISKSEPAETHCPYCGKTYDAKENVCSHWGAKPPEAQR
jgi:biopolymer transport protein ExbB/TolQ